VPAEAPSSTLWRSPLLLAIVGSAGTLCVAIFSNAYQLYGARDLEQRKLESSLILKAFEPPDEAERKKTLMFLLNAGLIHDRDGRIQKLAEQGVPHVPPAQSGAAGSRAIREFLEQWEGKEFAEEESANAQTEAQPVANEVGITSQIGLTVLADSIVQHGLSRAQDFMKIATEKVGGTPKTGVPERQWLTAVLEARASYGDKTPKFKNSIRRRVQELQQQVNTLPERKS
jgi:Glycosyl hydrolase family 46